MSDIRTKWAIFGKNRDHYTHLLAQPNDATQARREAKKLARRNKHLRIYISKFTTTADGEMVKHETEEI